MTPRAPSGTAWVRRWADPAHDLAGSLAVADWPPTPAFGLEVLLDPLLDSTLAEFPIPRGIPVEPEADPNGRGLGHRATTTATSTGRDGRSDASRSGPGARPGDPLGSGSPAGRPGTVAARRGSPRRRHRAVATRPAGVVPTIEPFDGNGLARSARPRPRPDLAPVAVDLAERTRRVLEGWIAAGGTTGVGRAPSLPQPAARSRGGPSASVAGSPTHRRATSRRSATTRPTGAHANPADLGEDEPRPGRRSPSPAGSGRVEGPPSLVRATATRRARSEPGHSGFDDLAVLLERAVTRLEGIEAAVSSERAPRAEPSDPSIRWLEEDELAGRLDRILRRQARDRGIDVT